MGLHRRLSRSVLFCLCLLFLGTSATSASSSHGPQVSSVVDSLCGTGTAAAITSSSQEAYVDMQSGNADGAIAADRKTMATSYACLFKPIHCNPGDSNCSVFDEVVAVYLRNAILSSQINLWNALLHTSDTDSISDVITSAMRNAVDLCKFEHILANTTPMNEARSTLTLAIKYASSFAASSATRSSVEYQLDGLRQCSQRLGLDATL
jgi:hypothetical protein